MENIQLPQIVGGMEWGGLSVSPFPVRFPRRPTLDEIEGHQEGPEIDDDYDTKWEGYGEAD
jgi:hypothetical protein